jgi:catechol 2,3-dioxygenase-like lactoylglutathione lyase family enzyme
MKRTSCTSLCLIGLTVVALGAAAPTATYDNVHVRVTDPDKATQWYVAHLGATKASAAGRVLFGTTRIVFVKTDKTVPSAGSVIDHLGLSFANADAKMKELADAGAKVLNPIQDVAGLFKYGVVEDPWGVKFEVVQDSELLGFHHVHLRVRDPKTTLDWYEQLFGGERSKLKGRIDGLRYGSMWLLAADSRGENVVPSAGTALDNIAWNVPSIDAAATTLRSKGAKFVTEPRTIKDPYGSPKPLQYTMVEDSNGVKVEVLQRP